MKPQHWAWVFLLTFAASLALIGAIRALRPPPAATAESFAEAKHTLEPLFPAPPFAYVAQTGATVTSLSLKGQPYVANFIFTTCRTVCPLLTSKMVQLQRLLPGAAVRFVSFSVDPRHDSPETLAAYAHHWNAEEPRWVLLSTDERTLPVTAAGFHVTAMRAAAPSDVDPIIHSSVFLLVDAEGIVRGAYDSEHREDFEALVRDTRTLSHAPTPPPAPARDGATLYHQLSCANCHERAALAPSLGGLLGTRRELEASNLVTADRAYLEESILVPEAKRVRGYTLQMPAYDGLLSRAELDALVDYVVALPAPEGQRGASSREVAVAEDPVCHMKVRVTDDVLHADFDGGTHYFCSEYCREHFQANPALYLRE